MSYGSVMTGHAGGAGIACNNEASWLAGLWPQNGSAPGAATYKLTETNAGCSVHFFIE